MAASTPTPEAGFGASGAAADRPAVYRHGNSWMQVQRGIKYVRLDEADPYRSGYAYGRLLLESGEPIIALMQRRLTRGVVWLLCRLAGRHLRRIRVPTRYADEIRGYADATGIAFEHLFFMNFLFDILKEYGFHCSTLVFFNPEGTLVGRNTDLMPALARIGLKYYAPIVLDLSMPGQRRFSHVSIPFFVGVLNGFNQDGLAVSSHQIIEVDERAQGPRLGSSLLMRMLLEGASSVEQAARIVQDNPTTRSLNVAVSSDREQRGAVFEVHPNRCHEVRHAGNFGCTTHFDSAAMAGLHNGPITPSQLRLASIGQLAEARPRPDLRAVIDMLKDQRNGLEHRLSGKSLTNHGTYQSFVFDLRNSLMLVSNGTKTPASLTGDYVAVRVNGTATGPFDVRP